jgi:hypothetical protein
MLPCSFLLFPTFAAYFSYIMYNIKNIFPCDQYHRKKSFLRKRVWPPQINYRLWEEKLKAQARQASKQACGNEASDQKNNAAHRTGRLDFLNREGSFAAAELSHLLSRCSLLPSPSGFLFMRC